PAAKFFAKRTHKTPGCVVNNHGFAPHAGLVDSMGDVDQAMLILRQAVCVSPDQTVGRDQPVMYTLIGVRARSDHRQVAARLVRCLEKERRQRSSHRRLRAFSQEVTTRVRFHAIRSGTTFAGTTPVSFCSNPWNLKVNLSWFIPSNRSTVA